MNWYIIAATCGVILIINILFAIRNEWVCRQRLKMLEAGEYNRLPSYDEIMDKWWVWDINKLRKP